MTSTPRSYHATALLTSGGLWHASVTELPDVHAEHRSLSQLERRVRRAIANTRDDLQPEDIRLEVEVSTGDKKLDREIADARAKRELSDELARQARAAALPIARRLVDAGVSHRDAGTLLGTSAALVSSLVSPKS
ncbi:hypothetical protein [Streptomyces sp. NPDC048623]|uniref:hypothetical protein n=1 Tax=Streptomyces sp. NPDC048623 TaxID=3155761 RepID=UPI0034320D95